MNVKQLLQERSRNNELIIGSKETIKKQDELEKAIIASNTPQDLLDTLEEELDGVEIIQFDGTNDELGSLCGKPFAVATVGIKKQQQLV